MSSLLRVLKYGPLLGAALVLTAPLGPQAGEASLGRLHTSGFGMPRPVGRPSPAADALPLPRLDDSDEIAALEALQLALTEVGDGAAYVWHRRKGELSGIVQPTTSFKDARGNVCRHIVVVLSSGRRSKRTEGIACRLASGVWQLGG
jgi:hypothetical protein